MDLCPESGFYTNFRRNERGKEAGEVLTMTGKAVGKDAFITRL